MIFMIFFDLHFLFYYRIHPLFVMYIQLRERALHAQFPEAQQQIVIQNTHAGIDIFSETSTTNRSNIPESCNACTPTYTGTFS